LRNREKDKKAEEDT